MYPESRGPLRHAECQILQEYPKWMVHLIGWISLVSFCSIFVLGPITLVSLLFLLPKYPEKSTAVFVLLCSTIAFPVKPWRGFRKIFQLWYPILDFRHNLPEHFDSSPAYKQMLDKPTIVAMHPHGIIPIHGCIWASFCDQFMNTFYGFGATANIVFFVPFLKTIMQFLDAREASYNVLKAGLLQRQSLFIMPGGVAEIFLAAPGSNIDRIIIRRRRKLMKLALETGADLIPVYVFGGKEYFKQVSTSENALCRFSRKMRMGMTLFWGQYGLPIPFPAKTSFVLGAPLHVNLRESPSDTDIDALLQKYMKALEDTVEMYREEAGYPSLKLQLL